MIFKLKQKRTDNNNQNYWKMNFQWPKWKNRSFNSNIKHRNSCKSLNFWIKISSNWIGRLRNYKRLSLTKRILKKISVINSNLPKKKTLKKRLSSREKTINSRNLKKLSMTSSKYSLSRSWKHRKGFTKRKNSDKVKYHESLHGQIDQGWNNLSMLPI